MTIVVTGTAGFIGNFVAAGLLARGDEVVGVDNLNPYYDVELKRARLARLAGQAGFTEAAIDLRERDAVVDLFATTRPRRVVHLAAQAGVRYSIDHPHDYADNNLVAFLNVLEGCRAVGVEHLVYASTSSVYGTNTDMPFSVHDGADHPISLYAATKRANELMAHSYSHLFALPTTGLRFFTVYGPWGRPDMALFKFARAIVAGDPIDVYNYGQMQRDFTYVDDIADGVIRLLDRVPVTGGEDARTDPARSATAPFRIYNIGNNRPIDLMRYIAVLEQELGRTAEYNMMPMQPGDVPATWADVDDLIADTGYRPDTPVEEGVARFVAWYKDYYKVN